MDSEATLTLEPDWLPATELSRLIGECRADFPELLVSDAGAPAHRGLDPTIAVAIIGGVFTALVPLLRVGASLPARFAQNVTQAGSARGGSELPHIPV